MAPSKVATKAKGPPKRFPPPKTASLLRDEDTTGEDAELQLARREPELVKEPAWEGFGSDDSSSVSSSSESDEEEDDDEEDADMADEEAGEEPKDEEEEDLERLVFGDSAGFMKGIHDFSLDTKGGTEESEAGEDNEALDALPDQDLFFFDSGPTPVQADALALAKAAESEEENDKPAWEDSDDERLVVSLASVPQLRKLRESETDDTVSGREYVRRLRKQYQRLYPMPDWALHAQGKAKRKRSRTVGDGESEEGSDMDVDSEDELRTQPLARLLKDADILARASRGPAKRRKLQAGTVDIQRLKDVCKKGASSVTYLSFHSSYPMLLSSGPSSTVSLYHVQPNPPNPNPLLASLHIKRTPLSTTAFHPSASDSRIFLSARRRYFHVWNLTTGTVEKVSRIYGHQHEQRTMEYFSLSPNGKYMALRGSSKKGGGVINILDATTLQWITQARIESRHGVADFVWWGDGNGLSIAGKNGEVTEWSIRDGIIGRWQDEGAVGTTVIAVGGKSGRDGWLGGDRWVVVGSSSGIVNIYDRRSWTENALRARSEDENGGIPATPKPLRVLENLTTPISHLVFSPDGQILCMSSRWKHNALRLVHLPSATVFKNWPTEKTSLGRISAVTWGRPEEADEKEGALCRLAVGNESGKVRLWEVRA